jgi:hypothetical protein
MTFTKLLFRQSSIKDTAARNSGNAHMSFPGATALTILPFNACCRASAFANVAITPFVLG